MPPTDPRFLDSTASDILIDLWAHRYKDDPKLKDEAVNPDYEDDLAAMEAEMGADLVDDEAPNPVAADDWDVVVDKSYGGTKP